MKKTLFTLIAVAAVFCISCNSGGSGMSDTAKKNLDAMHAIQKAFETKDFSKVGDYIAEDAVDHAGETGDITGLANIKANFDKMAAASENDKTTIVKELADDEYVMSWSKYTSKLKVDMMGKKAGETMEMVAIEVCKFKDGKIVEHWSFIDVREMMKAMPQPTMTMPADTTKKDTTKKM